MGYVPESPILKPHEVAKLLEKRGFVLIRQRGSHKGAQRLALRALVLLQWG